MQPAQASCSVYFILCERNVLTNILTTICSNNPTTHSICVCDSSDGKGEWSVMEQAFVEEGWWAWFEKSVRVWSEGKEEVRTTKEDAKDASGEGEQEC